MKPRYEKRKSTVRWDEGRDQTEDGNNEFLAGTGWLRNSMKYNGLSLRHKTSIAQKDPDKLIDKPVSFLLQVPRLSSKYQYQTADIIAMDETPICASVVSDTTVDTIGTNIVTVKRSGHETAEFLSGASVRAVNNPANCYWTNSATSPYHTP